MKATLVFDSVNDLLYYKWDDTFIEHMKSLSDQESDSNVSDSNCVSQLLAPIITSQRVMAAQFGNTYSSMQCKDNTTIVFDEWLDHVFIIISEDAVDDAHRELLDCKTLVQHICGQNINLLQSPIYHEWLSVLLECRTKGDSYPGAYGVIGSSNASVAALNALKAAAKDIKLPYSHYHLMLFVGDKMLSLYSSRGCEDLSPPDLIMLSIQCVAAQEYWQETRPDDTNRQAEVMRLPWLSEENSGIVNLCAASDGPSAAHSLHLAELAPRVTFAVLVDMDLREMGVATHMSNQILSNLRRLLLQRNLEQLPNTLDSLEAAVKKTTDALRKFKNTSALCSRVSARMCELRRSCVTTTPLTPETCAAAMHTALQAVLAHVKPDIPSLKIETPLKELRTALAPYVEFLRVKAMRFFSLGSGETARSSLTVHKYLEEFPGLVHFVFVDRGTGRSLAPDIADCADMLTQHTVRQLMSRSFAIAREGYCAGTWRRGALHVCYVSWWERGAAAVRPARPTHCAAVRALPPPGDIGGSFYRQLTELAFPSERAGVSLKELVCVHLGLLPAATAVQQARALAHSHHELHSHTSMALHLL